MSSTDDSHSETSRICEALPLSWLQFQYFQVPAFQVRLAFLRYTRADGAVRIYELHTKISGILHSRPPRPQGPWSISLTYLREKRRALLYCLSRMVMTVYEASTGRFQLRAEPLPHILTLFPNTVYCWSMHG